MVAGVGLGSPPVTFPSTSLSNPSSAVTTAGPRVRRLLERNWMLGSSSSSKPAQASLGSASEIEIPPEGASTPGSWHALF